MKRIRVRPLLLAAAVAVVSATAIAPTAAYAQVKPGIVRFVAEVPPPPHPSWLAMQYFAGRFPHVIPGSEARL